MLDYTFNESKPISRKKSDDLSVTGAQYLGRIPTVLAERHNWEVARSGHSVNLKYTGGQVPGDKIQVTVSIGGETVIVDTNIVG